MEVDPSDALLDAELVARAVGRDQAAYERLIRRHFRVAFSTAIALTGSPQDAEDVCQDALVRAYDRLAECRAPDRFRAWLIQIVRNRAHNHRRRESVRAATPLDVGWESPVRESPAHDVERAELRTRLTAALATLSPVQRAVVLLHDLEGCTHREISAGLAISEVMARRHLSDARRRLRGVLGSRADIEPARPQ